MSERALLPAPINSLMRTTRRPLRSDGTRTVTPEVVEPRRERVILEETKTIVVRVRRRWIKECA